MVLASVTWCDPKLVIVDGFGGFHPRLGSIRGK
jgi:hypothetical protein